MSPEHSFNLLPQLAVAIFQCRGDCKTATTNSINKFILKKILITSLIYKEKINIYPEKP
nr:MAG TPA: hypothetical protein [Caudoviricetes sp.]